MKLVLAAIVVLGAGAPAHAYPQWQFSSGATRCSSCHFSPAGGGLLNGFGRDQAGDELSSFGGDGSLLHGAATLPDWLSVGADLRGAVVVNDVQDPGGTHAAAFPMQADLALRVRLPAGLSVSGIVGLRGQVRDPDELVPDQNYQPVDASRLVSREHYIMWRPSSRGLYARLGRFYAPFGLRLPEHVFYVRRDTGFDLMEESYNLSVGWLGESSEVHVTAFAPDELRHIGGTEWGGAALVERTLGETALVGLQAKIAKDEGVTRWIGGGLAKAWVRRWRTMFLAEADLIANDFEAAGVGSTVQLVALGGVSLLPVRGLSASIYGERSQNDLRVSNSAWNAGSLQLSWIPYAHVELQLFGRLQFPAGGATARTLLVQLHYFL